jgi:hypothetical protein
MDATVSSTAMKRQEVTSTQNQSDKKDIDERAEMPLAAPWQLYHSKQALYAFLDLVFAFSLCGN